MARHSKWAKIKRSKAVTDSKRGKIFTKHAKLIQVAARGGGDPSMNPILRAAIDNARADNLPFENIERAIKKGTGESKEASQIEEVIYEGFGPAGAALLIQALTDNRNRTITNLKIIMGKNGGRMGAAGSVNYLFEKRGVISLTPGNKPVEEIELAAIDAGAIDVSHSETEDGSEVEIFTNSTELMQVKKAIEAAGIKCGSSELAFFPLSEISISDDDAQKLVELMELLEEDDDVLTVFTNAMI